jgi:FixJ family two-component response regulator
MTASNVFVVDDDPSVRSGVARLLRSADYQVETFATAEEFLDAHEEGVAPACLVLDVQMPGSTGLELQERLLRKNSTVGIVFITGHGDIPTTVRAVKNGAVNFLAKPFDQGDLLGAVEQALAKSILGLSVQRELDSIQSRLNQLTQREREVFGLVVTGLLNKQIADRIGTTEKTVKVHRGRVMEKMQVRSLAELVQLAVKIGLSPKLSQNSLPEPLDGACNSELGFRALANR